MILNLIMFGIGDIDSYVNSSDNLSSTLNFAKGRIGAVVPAMSWIGFGVCLIMIIWCAIKLAMSAGNPQKRDLAMEILLAVIYLLMVVPVAALKIRHIYDSLI